MVARVTLRATRHRLVLVLVRLLGCALALRGRALAGCADAIRALERTPGRLVVAPLERVEHLANGSTLGRAAAAVALFRGFDADHFEDAFRLGHQTPVAPP